MKRKRKIAVLDAACAQFPHIEKEKLLAMIYCREIDAAGERPADPRHPVDPETVLEIISRQYISRGGFKLAYALDAWNIDVTDLVMIDAGASSGGFTDCLLQRGASRVHAVDVGYNQLDYTLRIDSRVSVWERTNIMDVAPEMITADAAAADLSFRSIRGAASHILSLTKQKWLIALIKPQFEVHQDAQFKGVITDDTLRQQVLDQVCQGLLEEHVAVKKIVPSPIRGRRGNVEYLALLEPEFT